MPLALLAKDSIQDLEALAREAEHAEKEPLVVGPGVETSQQVLDVYEDLEDEEAFPPTMNEEEEDEPPVANPQQAQEETLPATRRFDYDYSSYMHHAATEDVAAYYDHYDTYAPVILGEKTPSKSLWQCLLPCWPWAKPEPEFQESYSTSTLSMPLTEPTGSSNEDEVSTNSDMLGERLSQKERQAVLARLRLAQPEKQPEVSKKGLLNGIPVYDTSPLNEPPPMFQPRSILKRRASKLPTLSSSASVSSSTKPSQRRSLFPSNYESSGPKTNHNVSFAPMARVVTVKSKNDMAAEEKADIWWQKSDYEDFRKTGRIITKAMVEGGSEIWLHEVTKESPSPSPTSSPAKDDGPADLPSTQGDKWWHRFGHSRRGLEHVVSFEEGRQRQQTVRNAIHAVLEEQARQKRYRREDPEKLRIVSLNNTSWARDLALASGASDADAVRKGFAEDRKSREFYLLKMARQSPTVTTRRVPQFMQPVLHMASPSMTSTPKATIAHRLDDNTAAQIHFRQEQAQKEDAAAPPPPPVRKNSDDPETHSEPIKDPPTGHSRSDSMAQRGKGFSAEGDARVDMSAVLSGMGALPQETAPATTVSS